MEYKDYYAILGVDKKAAESDIKHAYRRLARKYHPDVSKEANAENKFKDVQEAYEVLKDKSKREAYDQLGSNGKAGQEFNQRAGAGGGFNHQGFSEEDLGGFSDFFANMFGNQGGRARRGGFEQRGEDQHASINITLEDAYHGASRTISLQEPSRDMMGRVRHETRTLKVNIPKGAMPEQQLRLSGQGTKGSGGGPAGDLYLKIHIAPHTLFTLKDHDIYLTLPITPWEAALGAEINVPTLGGKVGLKVAPGSQGGQRLRLRGRGMPGKSQQGDQYVVLQIEIPVPKTDEEKAIYQNMAKVMPFNPRKEW